MEKEVIKRTTVNISNLQSKIKSVLYHRFKIIKILPIRNSTITFTIIYK